MNIITRTLALSLAVAMPAIAFAQASNHPLTRAQVQGELVQLEHAGYRPNKSHYPADIQAAEARVAAQGTVAGHAKTGYGSTAGGTSQSGHPMSNGPWHALYGHH